MAPPTEQRRQAGIARLVSDLELDHVLTLAQVQQRYRLSRADAERAGLPHRQHMIRPSKRSTPLRVHFIARDATHLDRSEAAIRHLAGTAEIRTILGNPSTGWSSSAWHEAATMVPDALWQHPSLGEIAIEYDSGGYTRQRILDKAAAFCSYPLQVWGCASDQRAANVRQLTADFATNILVVTAAAFNPRASTPTITALEQLVR